MALQSPGTECAHTEPRPYCYRCDKPLQMCLCRHLQPIANTVPVHVLQHPRERRHPLGTVRLLRLGLDSVHIHPLEMRGRSGACAAVQLPAGAGLLYPSKTARELGSLPAEDVPRHLVVIDGTWNQAHRVYRDNPWIGDLPHYRLPQGAASRYRIRAEPRPECLSTVESVVVALRHLEPDLSGTERLIDAFDAMIDDQILASAHPSKHTRTKRPRQAPSRAVPAVLLAPDAQIVMVYTEAAPGSRDAAEPLAPIRLSAVSLCGDQTFDQLISSVIAPDAHLATLMEIEPGALNSCQPLPSVVSQFRSFCTRQASEGRPLVLVSWNVTAQRWLSTIEPAAACVALKGVWANLSRARVPTLDRVVQGLALSPGHCGVSGRAGRRLMRAKALTQHILEAHGPDR